MQYAKENSAAGVSVTYATLLITLNSDGDHVEMMIFALMLYKPAKKAVWLPA